MCYLFVLRPPYSASSPSFSIISRSLSFFVTRCRSLSSRVIGRATRICSFTVTAISTRPFTPLAWAINLCKSLLSWYISSLAPSEATVTVMVLPSMVILSNITPRRLRYFVTPSTILSLAKFSLSSQCGSMYEVIRASKASCSLTISDALFASLRSRPVRDGRRGERPVRTALWGSSGCGCTLGATLSGCVVSRGRVTVTTV